ncbi:hypothetical protein ACJRO7_018706 [Eucalyptus globulus]|uniref:Response regulatory domain-containing protein n=1 Tax=Eucalyptus globulus TaxID=34317 RepID=A0ABD3KW14_EUCGL
MSPPPNEPTAKTANPIESWVQYADLVPAGAKVLVVERDSVTLAIASRMLLMFGYKVVTAKSTGDALSIIQERQDNLDLILTEIHLPDADKFEVLEKLGRASNLLVIVMTADNNEGTILGALLNVALFYLLKLIDKFDIRGLWQFSFMRKRDQMAQVTEDNTDQESSEEEGNDEPKSQLPVIAAKQGEARPRKQECEEVLSLKKSLQLMNVRGLRIASYHPSLKKDQDTILKMVHPESHRLSSTMDDDNMCLLAKELVVRWNMVTTFVVLEHWFLSN